MLDDVRHAVGPDAVDDGRDVPAMVEGVLNMYRLSWEERRLGLYVHVVLFGLGVHGLPACGGARVEIHLSVVDGERREHGQALAATEEKLSETEAVSA